MLLRIMSRPTETIEIGKAMSSWFCLLAHPVCPVTRSGRSHQSGPTPKSGSLSSVHRSPLPRKALNECAAIDFICRREFDFSVVEFAKGKPLDEIPGVSYLKNGVVVHNADPRR